MGRELARKPVINAKFNGRGWVDITLNLDSGSFEFDGSYLLDSPPHLVRAARALLDGWHESTVRFAQEPGEYRLRFIGIPPDVQVQVLWFPKTFAPEGNEHGKEVFSGVCRLIHFARDLQQCMTRSTTEEQRVYEDTWGHPYPGGSIATLQDRLKKAK